MHDSGNEVKLLWGLKHPEVPRLARLSGLMDKRIAKAREVVPEARDAARTCKP